MNVINISEEMMKKINAEALRRIITFNPNDIVNFASALDTFTFDNYYIKVNDSFTYSFEIKPASKDTIDEALYKFKEIFMEAKNFNKNIKTISLYNYFDVNGAFSLDLTPFVAETFNGQQIVDFFAQASEEVRNRMSDEQISEQGIFGMYLLISLEKRFKKEQRRIKKKMPTPEQAQQITAKNQYYKSEPIGIGNISIQYVYDPHQARSYSRHCECWGVKGHYRHLKNGKKVYIKPYTKGKGTPKVTDYYFEKYFEDLKKEE